MNLSMTKYNSNDMQTLTDFHEAIRKRAYMYSPNPHDPLEGIIKGITDSFEYLDVKDFRVLETDDVISLEAQQDWLRRNENLTSVEMVFNELRSMKGSVNDVRAEVYLKAFYYDFYTFGAAGNYGDESLMSSQFLPTQKSTRYIGTQGRVLIVSKMRNLPEDHNICFEVP